MHHSKIRSRSVCLPLLHPVLTVWVLPLGLKIMFKKTECSDFTSQSLEIFSHHRPDSTTADNFSYSASSLKFALPNVRSLTNKTFIINDFTTSHRLYCILLTETCLDEISGKELIEASPPNFHLYIVPGRTRRVVVLQPFLSDNLSRRNILFGI